MKKDNKAVSGHITPVEFSEIMSRSYIDYAMSVIVSRALPDSRDGLKPVQRRVIYAMGELGNYHDRPHRKCARIVGDTMGKYHPHGDSSIYECLVNMSLDFKKTVPLVDGHGNFGSMEGDGPAAMRYTEVRLKELTQEAFLADIDKDTVDFAPNFDETEKEPVVLPALIPNLLVSGAEGIAVGMATNIPTHNLGEAIDAEIAFLKDPSLSTSELLWYLKGPDWPTGGIIINGSDLWGIYENGTGRIKVRGKIEYEPAKNKSSKDRLIVTQIPPTMVGAGLPAFFSDLEALAQDRLLSDISDISNQSDKDGVRIVFELKKGADPQKVMNLLYRKTRLENTFGVNMLAISEGRPKVMNLPSALKAHADFLLEITERKYTSLLAKERERLEVQEGLIRAVDIIDLIIEIIRGSKDIKQARAALMGQPSEVAFKSEESRLKAATLAFTQLQANAILDLRLSKLIGLEILALQKEYKQTRARIKNYRAILEDDGEKTRHCIRLLEHIKEKYATPRRTMITDHEGAHDIEEESREEELIFAMDRFGYARVFEPSVYERNADAIQASSIWLFSCMSTDRIRIFTDTGDAHLLKAENVPLAKAKEKGVPIDNLCNFDSKKETAIFVGVPKKGEKLLFCTKHGLVKIVDGSQFETNNRTVKATRLADGDLIACINGHVASQVVIQTRNGAFLRFSTDEIPEAKKTAMGVKGIKLSAGDEVCLCWPVDDLSAPIGEGDRKIEPRSIKLKKRGQPGIRKPAAK